MKIRRKVIVGRLVWKSRLGLHPARNAGADASSSPGEEKGLDEEIDTGGRVNWLDDIYGLFYHAFLGVSLLVCIVLIWMPHWPFRSIAIQQITSASSVRQRVGKVLEKYRGYSAVIVVCRGIVIGSLVEGIRLGYGEMVEVSI